MIYGWFSGWELSKPLSDNKKIQCVGAKIAKWQMDEEVYKTNDIWKSLSGDKKS